MCDQPLTNVFLCFCFDQRLTMQTVQRMFCVTFPAGATIIQQNSQPSAEDCMYFLQQGSADVVIMGTVDASSKHGEQ
jgi:hypothetical protein